MITARICPRVLGFVLMLMCLIGNFRYCLGQSDESAAQLFPSDTLLYLEVNDPKPLIQTLQASPLRKKVLQSTAYKAAVKGPDILKLQVALGLFEGHMEMPWQDALLACAEGGMYVAWNGQKNAPALLMRARDEQVLEKLKQGIVKVAKASGNPDAIKSAEYRGIQASSVNEIKFAVLGKWFLVTSNNDIGKQIIDRYLDHGTDNLASTVEFSEAREKAKSPASVWGFANVNGIRKSGKAKDLFLGKADNILAEAILGGLLTNLQHTAYAATSMELGPSKIQWTLYAPHQTQWNAGGREYYFGSHDQSGVLSMFRDSDTLFTLSAHRDLSQMWLRASDLMTDQAIDDLAQADAQLTTFFSGKDFGEDILGAFGPKLQVVVARQEVSELQPVPAVKLPAFAIVFQLNSPDTTIAEFRRIFISFLGFLNITGAMNGQPQLDIEIAQLDGFPFLTTRFIPLPAERGDTAGRIQYNFSPTLAFDQKRMVLSSTRGLAEQLIGSSADQPMATPVLSEGRTLNTAGLLDVRLLTRLLEDNRSQLIAQNMLEKGHSQAAAEVEVGTALEIASWFREAQMELTSDDSSLQFQLKVEVAE